MRRELDAFIWAGIISADDYAAGHGGERGNQYAGVPHENVAPTAAAVGLSQEQRPAEQNYSWAQAMLDFGDEPTLAAVLQLSAKIVEPAPDAPKKMKKMLPWFGNNLRELKARMQQPQTGRVEVRRLLQAFPRGSRDVLGVLDNFQAISRLVD